MNFIRPKERWIGGVCSGICKHFKFSPSILRVLLIVLFVLSIYYIQINFVYILILVVYFALWLVIPNYKKEDLTKKYSSQRFGSMIGAVFFPIITISVLSMLRDYDLMLFFFIAILIVTIPIGIIIGFFISRWIFEKNSI